MRSRALVLGGAVVIIAVLAIVYGFGWRVHGPVGEAAVRLQPDDAVLVSSGKALYAGQCASCHGADLAGEADWKIRKANGRFPAPPHDPSGHTWHHPDTLLFALTKFGPAKLVGEGYESDMPGFEGTLSDREIVAVLSYIKSTWPADIRQRHDMINRQAEQGS